LYENRKLGELFVLAFIQLY